ncbi:MAG: type IV secretion protein Rhs [Pyrinomonadaceae bacterium]
MSGKRDLTSGEVILALDLFQDSIRYERIKIHNGRYFFKQPANSGMTPNGEIYVSGAPYRNDYSAAGIRLQAFFIHEMTHVWQYQNKILRVRLSAILGQIRHLGNYGKMYKYVLEDGKDLIEYGIEQQASIVEDYFILIKRGLQEFRGGRIQNQATTAQKRELLTKVMTNFIADPGYPVR